MKEFKFEIVFKDSIEDDEVIDLLNNHLAKIFGKDCIIDWRDPNTVEIRSTVVKSVESINYEQD